jgi:hypothetical protein
LLSARSSCLVVTLLLACDWLPHQHHEWPESDPLGAFARRPRLGSVLLLSPIRLHLPRRSLDSIPSDGQARTGGGTAVVKLWINEGNLIDSQQRTGGLSGGKKAMDASPPHFPSDALFALRTVTPVIFCVLAFCQRRILASLRMSPKHCTADDCANKYNNLPSSPTMERRPSSTLSTWPTCIPNSRERRDGSAASKSPAHVEIAQSGQPVASLFVFLSIFLLTRIHFRPLFSATAVHAI